MSQKSESEFYYSDNWCLASERRLLQKLINHKPAGINRQLNMVMLQIYMNNIFEDEEDINFEDYLNEIDLEIVRKRNKEGIKCDPKSPMAFQPSYVIRPTIKQIEKKLNEYYALELIQENELLPEALEKVDNDGSDLANKVLQLPTSNN